MNEINQFLASKSETCINENFNLKAFKCYYIDSELSYLEDKSCKKRVPFFYKLSHHLMVIGGYHLNKSSNDLSFISRSSKLILNDNCEYFNSNELNWNVLSSKLNEKRCLLGSTFTKDRIFVVGGINENHEPLSSVEYFDPTSKEWLYLPSMESARKQPSVSVLNDSIYAVGGNNNDGL